jgi:hypothetical protein
MMEISLYFFKKSSNGEIKFYKAPISETEPLGAIIDEESQTIQNSEVRQFFQIYETFASDGFYYNVEEHTETLMRFVRDVVLENTQFSSVDDYRRNSRSKDYFPFDGFAILKKEEDGSFVIGIESLSDKLKLYKKSFLRLDSDSYDLDSSLKTLLIPNYTTILVKGNWDAQTTTISDVFLRSRFYSFFEKIFGYRERWKSRSDELKTS